MTTLKQLEGVFSQVVKLPELKLRTVDTDGNLTWQIQVNGEKLYCIGNIEQDNQKPTINVYQYRQINFVIAGRPKSEYAVAYQTLNQCCKFVSRFDTINQPIEVKKAVKILDIFLEQMVVKPKMFCTTITEYRSYKADLLNAKLTIEELIKQIQYKAKCLFHSWGESDRTIIVKSIYDDTVKLLERNCIQS